MTSKQSHKVSRPTCISLWSHQHLGKVIGNKLIFQTFLTPHILTETCMHTDNRIP